MSPEISAALNPLVDRVQEAQGWLADHNSDRHAPPLEGLELSGTVMRRQQELIDAMWDLLDVNPRPVSELGYRETLRLQGRLNTLSTEGHGK